MSDCIFCKIINKEFPALVISESEQIISFLALENHPLVIPKQHIENIYSLDDATGAAVMTESIRLAKVVKKALKCEGVKLVQSNEAAAGQTVFHYHMHIIPRWKNDGFGSSWDTKPVSDDIRQQTLNQIQAVSQSV